MEVRTISQVIQKAKTIKFADPVNRKSDDISITDYVVDEKYDINGAITYATGINLDDKLKNLYLRKMFVISCGASTSDDIFKKKYFR